ncbi:MAG: ATP-grasp domain-containing protein [Alphaproteobacteria bacterium]|nr:ATP-grasp domain-containing protein [Alphaproteobacteria bacterium]
MSARTVIITGTRAPAALDLARLFAAAGWRVVGADRLRWPISRLSKAFDRHHRLPWARDDHRAFVDRLAELIRFEKADLLLPTCEEAFFIARHKDRLEKFCAVACHDFKTMARLHDKARLPEVAGGLGVNVPETYRAENRQELEAALERLGGDVVLKPSYSRFASRALIRPDSHALSQVQPSTVVPWACQRFVAGEEFCTYGVANQGRMTAFAAYRPAHRVGKGSGILFEPVNLPEAEAFSARFAERHALNGQFAFDIIRAHDGRWHVIECNPRATSGVHLFRPQDGLPDAFLGNREARPSGGPPPMVGLAMLLIGLPRALAAGRMISAIGDWRRAQDVVGRPGDLGPVLTQWLALAEGLALAARYRCSPLAATTVDTEWNGEVLD